MIRVYSSLISKKNKDFLNTRASKHLKYYLKAVVLYILAELLFVRSDKIKIAQIEIL